MKLTFKNTKGNTATIKGLTSQSDNGRTFKDEKGTFFFVSMDGKLTSNRFGSRRISKRGTEVEVIA